MPSMSIQFELDDLNRLEKVAGTMEAEAGSSVSRSRLVRTAVREYLDRVEPLINHTEEDDSQ